VQGKHGHPTQFGNAPEGCPPSDLVACPSGQRCADDIGEGQPHEHGRDRTSASPRRHNARCNDGANAEKGAMVERRDNLGDQQRAVTVRYSGQHIAQGEYRREIDQQSASAHPARGQRHERSTEHHP